MPYMWVWLLTSFNNVSDNLWDVMIDQKSHVYWQEFEEFNMRFWTLRLRLLTVLNKPITMQELFRGAFGIKHYSYGTFQLPRVNSIRYQKLKSRYPDAVQDLHLSPGTVYNNCAGAPWDLFFFLGNYLFAIQVKSSDVTAQQPQTLDEKMLKTEYDKVKKAFDKLKNSYGEEFPIKNWVLFICTNGSRTANSLNLLKENCFVVDCENFKDFYGYTFSGRAEFSAANDTIDANTAKDYELKTVRGIGEETAKEICDKRPYYDEDDLYSKVNIKLEARKRIKVIKNA
ncbi:24781_t:CDS:2 [Gigaspora rosea]|nr:24781_t:CDS:2 [Gigaspora rosea]